MSRSRRKTWPLKERVQHFAQPVHENPMSLMIPARRSTGYSYRLFLSCTSAAIRRGMGVKEIVAPRLVKECCGRRLRVLRHVGIFRNVLCSGSHRAPAGISSENLGQVPRHDRTVVVIPGQAFFRARQSASGSSVPILTFVPDSRRISTARLPATL